MPQQFPWRRARAVSILECDFAVNHDRFVAYRSLDTTPLVRRQIVLAFRESLNNAARHSSSPQFECRVGGDGETFWFEVRDHGKGFDEATVRKGLGLNNLRKRAEALNGTVSIESQTDSGTVIRFTAPYRRSKRQRLP